MSLCAILFLLLSFSDPSFAGSPGAFPDLSPDDPDSLQEASLVLEEELKLASRPQTYLLVDLVAHSIHIKSHGVELHRIPIAAWSRLSSINLGHVYRLTARPPVVRRKIQPKAEVAQEPISLADMPVDYSLLLTPPLTIDVLSSAGNSPIQWAAMTGKKWWRSLKRWGGSLLADRSPAQNPHLLLEISSEQAQSLAWSLVDGMHLVIRRPSDK